ncbi:MAG: hypothetical protein ACREGD_00960 [Candidatus Saccharimonadales bacterium]
MAETIPPDIPPIPGSIPGGFLQVLNGVPPSLSTAELAQAHRVVAHSIELHCKLPAPVTHPLVKTAEYLGRISGLDRHGRCWGYKLI